jgi:hypothetical protein
MYRRLIVLALAGMVAVGLSGCASIVGKSTHPVNISSVPGGADFNIINRNGEVIHHGVTPAVVDLKASAGYFTPANYKVRLCKAGFSDKEIQIKQGLSPWYVFGNIFIGGLVGWVVIDPITGAMWTLEDVNANLDAQPTTMPATAPVQTQASDSAFKERRLTSILAGGRWRTCR